MTQQNINDLKVIAETYGYEAQSRKAIEEMAELTQAINKFWRQETDHGCPMSADNKEICWDLKIAEEIADVYSCLKQIELLLDIEDLVESTIGLKIKRTFDRMKS